MKVFGSLIWCCAFMLLANCSTHKDDSSAENETDSLTATSAIDSGEGLFSFAIDSNIDKKDLDEAIYDGFLKEFSTAHKDDSLQITNHSMVSNQFFTANGCLSARILELQLVDRKEGTSLIQWYLISERPQSFVVYEPIVEDVTERQGSAEASLELGYSAGDDCPVVAILTRSEGGDIDFSKQESIAFYTVDGGFNQVFRLQLENTVKEGYYNNPDSAHVTSTKRTFKFVDSDKFPLDIEAVVDDGSSNPVKELYTWVGTGYQLKP